MSIIPVYLSSFSNVSPHFRGTFERAEVDKIAHRDGAIQSDKLHKTANENDEVTKRSEGALVVRSGDVVSTYGDVFSLSQNGKQEESRDVKQEDKSKQRQYTKGDTVEELTEEEQQQVNELRQRDAEVKSHEAAHLGAAGGLARGGASYEYQKGPDGNNYAVGGEVSIDSSPVKGDPKATISKAQQIRSAALAPANPSSQDHKVAAKASQMEAEALQELSKQEQNPQDSSHATETQTDGDEEIAHDHPQSQYHSNTAVTKYAVQSYLASFVRQSAFRTFA